MQKGRMEGMNTSTDEMRQKLEEIVKKLDVISADSCWAYTQEYWMGLIDGARLLIKKVRDEL
jgi:hypothetical protein